MGCFFLFIFCIILVTIYTKQQDNENDYQNYLKKDKPKYTTFYEAQKLQNEKKELRRKELLETAMSIKYYKPTIYKEKTNRNYLKYIPELNIKCINKKTPLKDLENFVVLDVETTGLKPATDEILEISMIKFENQNPTECLTTLVKPKKNIPLDASLINNIYDDDVKNSPSISYIIPDFNDFIKGYNIVGYNLEFDLKFLYCNGMDFFSEKRKFYDCLLLTRKYFKYVLNSYKLDDVSEYCGLYRKDSHRATDDALVTGIIFRDIGKKYLNS